MPFYWLCTRLWSVYLADLVSIPKTRQCSLSTLKGRTTRIDGYNSLPRPAFRFLHSLGR